MAFKTLDDIQGSMTPWRMKRIGCYLAAMLILTYALEQIMVVYGGRILDDITASIVDLNRLKQTHETEKVKRDTWERHVGRGLFKTTTMAHLQRVLSQCHEHYPSLTVFERIDDPLDVPMETGQGSIVMWLMTITIESHDDRPIYDYLSHVQRVLPGPSFIGRMGLFREDRPFDGATTDDHGVDQDGPPLIRGEIVLILLTGRDSGKVGYGTK